MSYILNALRKSERERQAKQHKAPISLAMQPDSMTTSKITPIVWVLLGINLLALAYLLFRIEKPIQTNVPSTTNALIPIDSREPSASAPISTLPVVPSTQTSKSISELWSEQQKLRENEAPKALATAKPPLKKKAASVTKMPEQSDAELFSTPTVAASQPIIAASEAPEVLPQANQSKIPLLRELSPEFQERVPVSSINVLAYTEQPNHRFTLIDMVKYKIGQRIKDKVSVVDILPDAVVLRFEGQDFRLERP